MKLKSSIHAIFAVGLCLSSAVFAQGRITGTVTNKTTGKPAANDIVTLIRLAQGMQESTVTHTDARGQYTLALPDAGIHLVRVTHDKANYFGAAPPGTDRVDVDVYTAQPKVSGVTTEVEELHVEADATELHIVEVLEVQNQSSPAMTQFGPQGFDFYLPPGARVARTGAVTGGGMPVPANAAPLTDKPGHYTFQFPVRPGETQFGIFYSLPYSGSAKLPIQLATAVHTLAVVLPKTMTLSPGASPLTLSPGNDAGQQTYIAQNVTPSAAPFEITLSGTGSLPHQQNSGATQQPGAPQSAADANAGSQVDANGNPDTTRFGGGLGKPIDPDADRDPFSKYKWWILGGLALLLAAAAGVLLRRPGPNEDVHPTAAAPYTPVRSAATDHATRLEETLKEEMFALERDHLQRRVSDAEYERTKAALKIVLDRALSRHGSAAAMPTEGV